MKELSSGARALLKQYREESEINDRPDAAVLEGIEASIGERRTAASEGMPSEATPRAAAWVAWGAVAAASVATIWMWRGQPELRALGQARLSSAVDRVVEQTRQRARVSGQAVPPAKGVAPPSPVPPARAAPGVTDVAADPRAPRTRGRGAAPGPGPGPGPEAPAPGGSLQRELELLQQARVALREGRSADAKTSLRAHALSYPKGQLAEERDALRVVVRCTDGDAETGRVAFEASHPRSHHLPSIRAACDPKKTTRSVTDAGRGGQ